MRVGLTCCIACCLVAAFGGWAVEARADVAPNKPVTIDTLAPPRVSQPAASSQPVVAVPTSQPTSDAVESKRLGYSAAMAKDPQAVGTGESTDVSWGNWAKVVASLLLVVLLIYGLRWVLLKSGVARGGNSAAGGLEVMTRLPLSTKHQLLVVRFGQRLMVVGLAPESVTSLADISDPEDVAALLGELEKAKAGSLSNHFAKTLNRFKPEIDAKDVPLATDATWTPAAGATERLKELLNRIQGHNSSEERR